MKIFNAKESHSFDKNFSISQLQGSQHILTEEKVSVAI